MNPAPKHTVEATSEKYGVFIRTDGENIWIIEESPSGPKLVSAKTPIVRKQMQTREHATTTLAMPQVPTEPAGMVA